MVPVVVGRRSEEAAGAAPRVNVVAIAILVASVGLGILCQLATGTPLPLVLMNPRRPRPGAVAKDR